MSRSVRFSVECFSTPTRFPPLSLSFRSVQNTIRTVFESKRPVALVCHAPAVLTGVKLTDGSFIGKGRKVTGFTNAEEEQAGLTKNVQYLLEDVLKEQGAHFEGECSYFLLPLRSHSSFAYSSFALPRPNSSSLD